METGLSNPKISIYQQPQPDITLQEDVRLSLLISAQYHHQPETKTSVPCPISGKKMKFYLIWEVF